MCDRELNEVLLSLEKGIDIRFNYVLKLHRVFIDYVLMARCARIGTNGCAIDSQRRCTNAISPRSHKHKPSASDECTACQTTASTTLTIVTARCANTTEIDQADTTEIDQADPVSRAVWQRLEQHGRGALNLLLSFYEVNKIVDRKQFEAVLSANDCKQEYEVWKQFAVQLTSNVIGNEKVICMYISSVIVCSL